MKRVALVLFMLLASAIVARGAEHVRWVKSLEEALRQAKERGSMVFIAEIVNHEPANLAQVDVFKDPAFIKASRDFVCLFACPHGDTPTMRMKIDGKEVETSAFAPGMTRDDHVKAWNDVRADYVKLNTNSMGDQKLPFHFVINADGKVLATIANGTVEGGFDTAPVSMFIQTFTELKAKYGRGLSQDEYEVYDKRLTEAAELAEKEDFRKALKHVKAVLSRNSTSNLADRARGLRDGMIETGRSRLAAAEAGVKKDPAGTVIAFERIGSEFAGTEVAREAKALLASLKRDPAVKSALKQVAARKEAEKAYLKAVGEIEAKRYSKALKLLDRIVKKFPETEVGERARKKAEELRGDPEIAAAARDEEASKYCKSWLSMGRTYAANGMNDKARALFKKVIDKFPGTKYAVQAELELAKLR